MDNCYEYIEELDTYFAEIKHIRTLKRAEEKALAERIRKGDREAINTLVKHNLKFVVNIAKKYRNSGVPFSDLISEGNIGLFKAAEKFDSTKDIKFVSYAVWWIKYYIKECIKAYGVGIEETHHDEEIIRYSDKGDEINSHFENKLEDIESRRASIEELMKCLHEREIKILTLFYGLSNGKEMTLEEVGKETNLTMERVRQIKDNAIMKMRTEALMMNEYDLKTLKEIS